MFPVVLDTSQTFPTWPILVSASSFEEILMLVTSPFLSVITALVSCAEPIVAIFHVLNSVSLTSTPDFTYSATYPSEFLVANTLKS